MRNPFLSLWLQSALLGLEAQQVITLRMMRLVAGGAAAEAEWLRMWSEKPAAAAMAAFEAWASALAGRPGEAITRQMMRGYLRQVRANRRRLTR